MAPEIKTSDSLNDPTVSNEELKLYMDKKDSQLSTIHLTFAFMPLDKVVAKDDILKIKSLLLEETKNNKKFPASDKQYKLLGDWLQSDEMSQIEIFQRPHLRPGAVKPVPGKKYQTLVASSMHPFSRGSVHITSNSPLSPPAIDPQYLSHPIDVEIMAHSVRYTRQIAQTAPLTDKIIGRLLPGDEILLDDDIAKWKDVVRRTMGMGYHPVGTASMLPREDDGVVSSKLLVHGTENVRVVDASIIPMQISHHTQATVYAFAEKAADIMKEAYNQTK